MQLKTVGTLQDLVEAIADELRPWKLPKSQVLKAIRDEIEDFKTNPFVSQGPDAGFRSQNRQYAEQLIEALKRAAELLASPPPGFFHTAIVETKEFTDPSPDLTGQPLLPGFSNIEIGELPDRIEGQNRLTSFVISRHPRPSFRNLQVCSHALAYASSACDRAHKLADVHDQILAWIKYCETTIHSAAGNHGNQIHLKSNAARSALCIMEKLSTKRPSAGTRNTPFCIVASLFFEAVTGERESNLQHHCKEALREFG
jgi:hypothetical protein